MQILGQAGAGGWAEEVGQPKGAHARAVARVHFPAYCNNCHFVVFWVSRGQGGAGSTDAPGQGPLSSCVHCCRKVWLSRRSTPGKSATTAGSRGRCIPCKTSAADSTATRPVRSSVRVTAPMLSILTYPERVSQGCTTVLSQAWAKWSEYRLYLDVCARVAM